MMTPRINIVRMAVLLLTLLAQPLWAQQDQQSKETDIAFGEQIQIASKIYGEDREINIYVPQLPDWADGVFIEPLPVLYLVDGGTDQDFFHIAALSQLTLINAERQPMIVVGIRTYDRRPELTYLAKDPRYAKEFAAWQKADGADFRRYIKDEVMPFVEARYSTGRKAIMGESLAGLFVMEMLLRSPDMFDDYISVSPSLWWDDRFLSKNAANMLAQNHYADKRLYVTMANEGGTMQAGLDTILSAFDQGRAKGLAVKYVDRTQDDRHSTIYHHSARDALSWLYGIKPFPYGETPWYLKQGAEPSE